MKKDLTQDGRKIVGHAGSTPVVGSIFRRLEKRLVSSPFMLMHKRAYSNDNTLIVPPRTQIHRSEPKAVQFDSVGKSDSVLIQ